VSSKTRESSLWAWLRDGTKDLRPELHLTRIENLVGEGTPDVEGWYANQFWCELKALTRKPGLIDSEVSQEQIRWHRRRWQAGGRSWFLIQLGSSHRAVRFLIPGEAHLLFRIPVTEKLLEKHSVLKPSASPHDYVKMMGK